MQHVDPEILALIALGEDGPDVVGPHERAHLDACAECQEESADLAAVTALARTVRTDELEHPSPEVWARISAELGLDAPAAPAPAAPAPAAQPPVALPPARSERRHRGAARHRWGLVAAAASVALVLGVGAGIVWDRATTQGPTDTVIAQASLDALPDWPDASGQATIETAPDGTRQAVISMDAPPGADGYREVWLIAEDLSGLTSLGVLKGSEGRFDIPDDLDLAAFPLVDVSQEPLDGDPAHSGDSIVRGSLTAAPTPTTSS